MNVTLIEQADADVRRLEDIASVMRARADEACKLADAAEAEAAQMRAVREWLRQHSEPESRSEPESQGPAERTAPAEPDEVHTRTVFGRPVGAMTQADRVEEALEKLGRPAAQKDMRAALARDGINLDRSQVGGSVKYLARKGRIERVEGMPGMWRVARKGKDIAVPFEPPAALAMNGNGR